MAQKDKSDRKMWALRLTEEEIQMLKEVAHLDGVTKSGAFRMMLRREHKRRVKS